MTHLIKMKNSYLQRSFPSNTHEQVSSFFGFSSNEDLVCGIWTSPIFRHGFVITNKSLYWHFKTNDGIKRGKISKNSTSNINFEISPYISSESSVASLANTIAEECSKLEIHYGEQTEIFYISGLTAEKGKTLCDILKFGFTQNALPQIDLGELVKEMSFVPLRNFSDKFLNFGDKLAEELRDFKDYLVKGFHEVIHIRFVRKQKPETKNQKTNQEESGVNKNFQTKPTSKNTDQSAKSEEKNENQISVKKHGAGFSFLLNFLDIFASLLFIAGIVVFLKPKLITKYENLSLQPEHFSTIVIAIYTLLKSIVAFYSKKVYKKILPIILIVVSDLSYFLFSYSLIMKQNSYMVFVVISSILCLLSYSAFEYSCGYKTKTLSKKIITIVILGFIIYVFAQYALYDKVQKECLKTSAQNFWREISNFCKAW